MARTVKQEEHTTKRNDILSAAQRLIATKGYGRMTVQDLLDDLQISKGAFYHYFDSKQAVLEALCERMLDEADQLLTPLVHDPDLQALEKLQRFFPALLRWKSAQRMFVAELLRVWFTDDNAIVRQKVDTLTAQRLAPLLTLIIQQGISEGVLATPYPEQAGNVILSLIRGLQDALAELLLTFMQQHQESAYIDGIILSYSAYIDAIERTLGVPEGSLQRIDTESVKEWMVALRGSV